MIKIPRRSIVASALAAPALPRFAKAAEFSMRLGHAAPESFPLHARLKEAAEEVGRLSSGRVEISVFPESQLGSQVGMLNQVRSGTLDATTIPGQSLQGVMGNAFVQMVGFAFKGYPELWSAMDGDVGAIMRNMFKERLGMFAMPKVFDFGFRHVSTGTKVIREAFDIRDLKIRTPVDQDLIALFRALGASPLGMNLQDMIPALRNKVVDGQEGLIPFAQVAQLYNIQTNLALTYHTWDGQWICFNNKNWERLPSSLRDVAVAAFETAAKNQREDGAKQEAESRKFLEENGMKFNTVEVAGFRAKLKAEGYYAAAKQRVGDELWAALEKNSGRLG